MVVIIFSKPLLKVIIKIKYKIKVISNVQPALGKAEIMPTIPAKIKSESIFFVFFFP